MKIFTKRISVLSAALLLVGRATAQSPIADFSVSPNPVCAGQVLQITDLSSGSPTAWSYTVSGFGPGGGQTLTVQNPTVVLNGQGIFNITLVAGNASGSSAPVVHTVQVLPAPNAVLNPATQTTCIGGSVTSITVNTAGPGAGGTNTYSWSTGSTGSVLSLPSLSATSIYTCVITSTNGCSSTRQATVNIGSPAITVTSNPVYICVGSGSTLSATGSGGGPYSYTWSTAANTRTTTVTNAGVYNVTVTNAAGCTASQSYTLVASNTVAINAIATPSLLCAGNTATLRASGATSYTWSNGSTSATTTLSPNVSATYTVTGSTGTCSGSAAVTIVVSIQPTVTASASPSALCLGMSATLTANGADNYTWTAGVGTGSQVVVTPTANTTYTVRGQNQGCPSRTATVPVIVALSPSVTISVNNNTVCAGDEVALAANGAGSYTWANTGATTAIVLIQPQATTIYTVTGASANNCMGTATLSLNVDACTRLGAQSEEQVVIFPVPANDKLYVKGSAGSMLLKNIQGEIVMLFSAGDAEAGLDVSVLPDGLYFLTTASGVAGRIAVMH